MPPREAYETKPLWFFLIARSKRRDFLSGFSFSFHPHTRALRISRATGKVYQNKGWYTIVVMADIEKLKTQGRAFYARARQYVLSLRDVRNVGSLAFVVMLFLVVWSGARAIQTNYTLQKQVYELSKQNDVRRLENANLALTNNYYNTSQYLEVTARQNLGLAAPGETVLLVPKDVAMSRTVAEPAAKTPTAVENLPFWQRNFRAWMDFLLNRQSS